MMLDLAEALNPLLNKRKERFEAGIEDDDDVADITLQLVFFDGEEAFVSWTQDDSVYGSRLGTSLNLVRKFWIIHNFQAPGRNVGHDLSRTT